MKPLQFNVNGINGSFMEVFMKKILKKILLISLLFSAVAPSTMQAGFNLATLRNRAIEIGNKAANWLTTNGGDDFKYLVAKWGTVAVAGTALAYSTWIVSKQRALYNNLFKAIREKNAAKVQQILESGAKINRIGWEGRTALMLATSDGNSEIVSLLINKGADLNQLNNIFGWTALIKAASDGNSEIITLLVDSGADLNQPSKWDRTALMEAAKAGHLEIVKLLINMGTDLNQKTKDGWTLLMSAADGGNSEIFNLLINNEADLHQKTKDGWTILMSAARGGNLEIIKLLIDNGFDLNKQSKDGSTALTISASHASTISASHRHLKVVKLLLANGVDIDQPGQYGWTALMSATCVNCLEIVKLLLQKKANINKQSDDHRWTALKLATCNRNTEIIELLKRQEISDTLREELREREELKDLDTENIPGLIVEFI